MPNDPCLQIAPPEYLALSGAMTLPTAIQITTGVPARWMIVNPGIANQAGSASPGGLEWRIYPGILLPFGGASPWKTGYNLPMNPVAVGGFLSGAVIPWGDLLNYVVEIYGPGAWGAGSSFELSIAGFTPA